MTNKTENRVIDVDNKKMIIDIRPMSIIIDDRALHKKFIQAVIDSIESHIQSLGLIKGLMARNAYAAIKAVRPGYVEHIVEVMSKDYVQEFHDMHEAYRKEQKFPAPEVVPLIQYMNDHLDETKEHFWRVTDSYAQSRAHALIGRMYQTFRPVLKSHLSAVFQVIFDLIEDFTIVREE